MDEELSYKVLRKIQQMEKTSPSFTKLPEGFYPEVRHLLSTMEQAQEKETNAQKKMLIHDEYMKTKKIALSIYEYREKKLVQTALSTIRSGKPNLGNLTTEEQHMYDDLVTTMHNGRTRVWEGKQQETERVPNKCKNDSESLAKDNDEKPSTPTMKKPKSPNQIENTHTVVLLAEDIPSFMGTDAKEYSLKKHDLITLPEEMAEPLLKRKVAVKL